MLGLKKKSTLADVEVSFVKCTKGHLRGKAIFSADFFSLEAATRMAGHFSNLAEAAVAGPAENVGPAEKCRGELLGCMDPCSQFPVWVSLAGQPRELEKKVAKNTHFCLIRGPRRKMAQDAAFLSARLPKTTVNAR